MKILKIGAVLFAASLLFFLASCGGNSGAGGGDAGYTLTLSASSLTVVKGSSASVRLTVVPQNGFSGLVDLSLISAPAGVSLSPASVNVSGTTEQDLTISASGAAAAGSYSLSVKGSSGAISGTTALTLVVSDAPDFTLAVAESELSVAQTESGSLGLTITPLNGFNGTVSVSLVGAPAGVSISPTSVSVSGATPVSQTLTVSATGSAVVGDFAMQVKGAAGSISHQDGVSLSVTAAPGTQDWVAQLGGAGHEKAYGAAVADDGSVYVTGYTASDMAGETNHGHEDAFLAKYDSAGVRQWVKLIGTSDYDYGYAVTTLDNTVYVAGYTNGTLGDSHIGGYDAFLASYAADGTRNWLKQFGSVNTEFVSAIAARGSMVFAAGYTNGDVFGANQGVYDIFLAAYTTGGDAVAAQSLQTGTSGDDYAYGMALAPNGDKIIVGATNGAFSGSNQGGFDAFAIRVKANNDQDWEKQFGSSVDDKFWAVTVDQDGFIYAGGTTKGNLAGHASFGGDDPVIFKLDENGDAVWSKHIGNATTDTGRGVAVDASGDVYLTGRSSESMDPSDPDAAHIGNSDAYIVQFASDGARGWTRQFGTTNADEAYAIVAGDALYVAGATVGDMVGGSHTGDYDVFLARYAH